MKDKIKKFSLKLLKVALIAAGGAIAQELKVPFVSDAMQLFLISIGAM